jgi:cytoskeleton protein RodZ
MITETNAAGQESLADEQAEPPSVAEPARPTPGSLLQAQRETLELTLQQVAEQLNLTMHFIRSIESDSFDKLPGDVFVRGYIRSYARLLRLDPEQVLALYDEFSNRKTARKEEAIKRISRRRRDKNRPWIIISGMAFVGVAVALWYFNREPTASSLPLVNDFATLTSGQGAALAAGVLAQTAAETIMDAAALTPDSQRAAMDEIIMADLNSPEINLTDLGAQVEPDAEIPQRVSDIPEAASSTPDTLVLLWPGNDWLELSFADDSWLEIEHRGSDAAYRNLQLAGRSVRVQGTAPFTVLLGNARSVTVSYNNRQLDISNNIRSDHTARLNVGM